MYTCTTVKVPRATFECRKNVSSRTSGRDRPERHGQRKDRIAQRHLSNGKNSCLWRVRIKRPIALANFLDPPQPSMTYLRNHLFQPVDALSIRMSTVRMLFSSHQRDAWKNRRLQHAFEAISSCGLYVIVFTDDPANLPRWLIKSAVKMLFRKRFCALPRKLDLTGCVDPEIFHAAHFSEKRIIALNSDYQIEKEEYKWPRNEARRNTSFAGSATFLWVRCDDFELAESGMRWLFEKP